GNLARHPERNGGRMILAPSSADLDAFRALIARKLGLCFDDTKLDFLADVLRERMERASCDQFSTYENRLSSFSRGDEEIRALAVHLTVGEPYFFRYAEQFRALAAVVLPARIQAAGSHRTLRILSAGSSSGEEADPLTDTFDRREDFANL